MTLRSTRRKPQPVSGDGPPSSEPLLAWAARWPARQVRHLRHCASATRENLDAPWQKPRNHRHTKNCCTPSSRPQALRRGELSPTCLTFNLTVIQAVGDVARAAHEDIPTSELDQQGLQGVREVRSRTRSSTTLNNHCVMVWFIACCSNDAPLVAALTIVVSIFTATRGRGVVIPLCGLALLFADIAVTAIMFRI